MENVRQSISKIFGKNENDAPLTPYSDITKLCDDASRIWLDSKIEKKRERFRVAAESLLVLLTPDIISDPKFYRDVDGATHINALKLLSVFVPRWGHQQKDFAGTPEYTIVTTYVQNLISEKVVFPNMQHDPESASGRLSHIKTNSDLPNVYMDHIARVPRRIQFRSEDENTQATG